MNAVVTASRALGLALAFVLCARVAAAQTEEETRARAKQLFEQSVADYDAGRYEQALSGFQEAFRIRPHPLVRVNMANCYDKLGKPLLAIFHFEQFLEAGAGSPEQQKEVKSAVTRLEQQVGKVLLHVSPDGATVVIDAGEQRRAPVVEPVRLEAGKHAVEVRLEGYQTLQRSFTLKGGATLELNLALEPVGATAVANAPVLSVTPQEAPSTTPPEPAAQAPKPAPEAAAAPSKPVPAEKTGGGLPTSAWLVGGASAALLVAATITGVMALSAEADFERHRDTKFDPEATTLQRIAAYHEALDASDRADALALTTDILLGVSLIGAAVTTALIVSHDPGEPAPEGAPPKIAVRPSLGPRQASLQLNATF